MVGARPAHQSVDLVVGDERRDPGLSREGERPGRGQPHLAGDGRLGVGTGGEPGAALPVEEDGEPVVDGGGSGGPQEVHGQRHDLVDVHAGDLHLGEADRALEAVGAVLAGHGVPVDGDPQRGEGPGREGDGLARRGAGPGAEGGGDRGAPVEGQGHLGDPPVGVPGLGLDEVHRRDGGGLVQHDLPPLSVGDAERVVEPGGVEVAVEGRLGLVLGQVGERTAVGGGGDRRHAVQHGGGLGVGRGPGEQVQRFVAGVGGVRALLGRLGVPGVLLDGVPPEPLLAVGVGHHQVGRAREDLVLEGRVGVEGPGVEDGGIAGQQTDAGGVDDPRGVPVDHHRVGQRLGPDDGPWVVDRVRDQGGGPGRVRGQGQGGLVQRGDGGDVGRRRAVAHGVGQALRGHGQLGGQLLGRRGVVALVGLVVLDEDVPHAEQGHHRGEGVPILGPLLEGVVDGVERVGRGQRTHDLLLVGDEGPGEQAGPDGVDGVPPAVGAEVVPGEGVDPEVLVGCIEGRGRLVDVGRRGGRLGEPVGDDGAGPQRGRGRGHHPGAEGQQDQPAAAEPPGHGGDPGTEEHGEPQQDERGGPVRGPHGQAGRGVGHDRAQQPTEARRPGVGIGAHREHGAHHDEQDEIGPVPPPHGDGGEEGQEGHGEAGGDQPEVLRVGHRGLGPAAHPVRAVEVPVAQAPEDLGGQGGGAGGRDGLGVLEDVDAVGRLHLEAHGPPQGHQGAEQADPPGHSPRPPQRGLPGYPDGVGQPQGRGDAHVEDGAGIDAADQGHDQGEQCRVLPAPPAEGQDDEGDHPGQTGPGQEDHRDPTGVLEHVGGEHEGQGGDVAPRAAETDGAAQVQRTGPGGEEQGAHPQALGHPQRYVQLGQYPVERTHGQQVADVLVGDGPEAHVGIPQGDGLADVAARVQVEVGLGVVAHHPGLRAHHGDQGQHGERQVVDRGPEAPG